jgi:hypothetical protein
VVRVAGAAAGGSGMVSKSEAADVLTLCEISTARNGALYNYPNLMRRRELHYFSEAWCFTI